MWYIYGIVYKEMRKFNVFIIYVFVYDVFNIRYGWWFLLLLVYDRVLM